MELGSAWRAAPADEALRRAFPAAAFDDSGWEPVHVPGHWRSTPAFAASDGPVLYRHRFEAPRPAPGRRAWLTFAGVFYDGDVWLDASYVGATEGYFFPHTYEVTETLAARGEHTLAVEVGCSREADATAKRKLTGVFEHWDCSDPDWNPGGIWRPVSITETGPVRIARLRVLCAEARPERAVLRVQAELNALEATAVELRVRVGDTEEVVTPHTVAHGANRIRLQIPVANPVLWWPHSLGDQPLHDVTVAVTIDGVESDTRTVRTGLRQVRMANFIVTVNGERLFLKGTNQGPCRMALADATPAELERDVALARDANLDLLRVHAHVSRPELYDAADRQGLLLWQDMPLQWGYSRSVRRQAIRQSREAVDLLGHHPSIAMWCSHNEPLAIEPAQIKPARFFALQTLPTWNKSVLDRSITRALERADASRAVVAHSGMFPNVVTTGTDSHLYFGWYHGAERDLPKALTALPRLARFVSEFGAQAVPDSADFLEPARWPALDWDRLQHHHCLQLGNMDRYVPRAGTFEEWRAASQEYQATVLRYHVETLRRLKYRPAGGFCQFSFADGHPAITWSVLDHRRVPKAGYRALAAACAPVIVVADRPAPAYEVGDDVRLDVHVVSDLRRPLTGLRVAARAGSWSASWEGDVPADGCVRVGTVNFAFEQPVDLRLTLAGDGVSAESCYRINDANTGDGRITS